MRIGSKLEGIRLLTCFYDFIVDGSIKSEHKFMESACPADAQLYGAIEPDSEISWTTCKNVCLAHKTFTDGNYSLACPCHVFGAERAVKKLRQLLLDEDMIDEDYKLEGMTEEVK